MRRQNASEFAEDMREMRAAARELARQQEEIRKKMDALQDTPRRTLTDADQRKEVVDELGRQKERLTNLVDRATQVSQQTEDAEPLASRELYDTLRKFTQDEASSVKELQEELLNSGQFRGNQIERLKQKTEGDNAKALEATSEMLREGMMPQASQAEQRARGSINNLRRGVERAAERVVGDDAEALRLAQRQLDQLTGQLEHEMAQAQASGNTNSPQQAEGQRQGQEAGSQQQQNQSQQGNQGQQAQSGQQGQSNQGNQQGQQGQAESNNGQPNGERSGNQNSQEKAGTRAGAQGQNQGEQQGQGQREEQQNAQAQANQQQNGQQQGREGQSGRNAQQNPGQVQQGGRTSGTPRGSPQRNANRRLGSGPENAASGDLTEGWDSLFRENRREPSGPITGNDFAPWSDQLREVEEMVEIPSLRNDIATARERARQMRQEYKRDLKKPDWAVVRLQVMKPLVEVRNQIADELARREPKDKLVPIDRDPVPSKYSDLVRRYYEEIGKDK
jgi:hypothetical protein